MNEITCPECDAVLKLKSLPAPGKKIRCPKCSEVFRPEPAQDEEEPDEEEPVSAPKAGRARAPADDEDDEAPRSRRRANDDADERPRRGGRADDDDDDRPARRRGRNDDDDEPRDKKKKQKGKKQGGSAMLWVLIGGGVALIAAAVIVILVLPKGDGGQAKGKGPDGKPAAGVSKDSMGKIKVGMARPEIDQILGQGVGMGQQDIDRLAGEIHPEIQGDVRQHTQQLRISSWGVWRNPPGGIYVGFAQSKVGERAVIVFWASKTGTAHDYVLGSFAAGGVDQAVAQNEKETRILNDPRWKKGQEVRQLIVGQWRKTNHGYDFLENGVVKSVGGFDYTSAYSFKDDQHIIVDIPSPINPAQKTRTEYKVLVDANSLYMVEMDAAGMVFNGPYQRSKGAPVPPKKKTK